MGQMLGTKKTSLKYLFSLVIVLGAVLIQARLVDFIDKKIYLFIYPACFGAVLVGGFGPGLLATLICVFCVWSIFLPKPLSFSNLALPDALGLTIFLVTGIMLCFIARRIERSKMVTERALNDLQAAIRSRDEFISVASHELKTPLFALTLKLELLLRQIKKEIKVDKMESMLSGALQQSKRLNELIEKLLDVTKIRAGIIELNYEPTNLWESVNKVVSQALEPLKAAGCEVVVDMDRTISVVADRVRLEQIITNLLTNAIKYAPAHPVEISCSIEDQTISIEVKDHGPGMPPDILANIFDRFDRGHAPKNTSGLGLGLYIVRNLAKAQGGEIQATSELGVGTTFKVTLPRNHDEQIHQVKMSS